MDPQLFSFVIGSLIIALLIIEFTMVWFNYTVECIIRMDNDRIPAIIEKVMKNVFTRNTGAPPSVSLARLSNKLLDPFPVKEYLGKYSLLYFRQHGLKHPPCYNFDAI